MFRYSSVTMTPIQRFGTRPRGLTVSAYFIINSLLQLNLGGYFTFSFWFLLTSQRVWYCCPAFYPYIPIYSSYLSLFLRNTVPQDFVPFCKYLFLHVTYHYIPFQYSISYFQSAMITTGHNNPDITCSMRLHSFYNYAVLAQFRLSSALIFSLLYFIL